MINKFFYNEEDYKVVMKLLNNVEVSEEEKERVKTRQLFLEMK